MIEYDNKNTLSLLRAIKYSEKEKLDTSSCFNDALIAFAHTPVEHIEEVA